ncbi:MAG: hypothetical protein A4S09_14680 [Proteobacteria bacterium SG_bin7]|nr:MAG: hypothetical protein A4S09_14680 [Proteobacteria bacterium SG_bin7]
MIDEIRAKEIAALAQLKMTDEEAKTFASQLARVIEYFDQIANIDTQNMSPLVTATDIDFRARPDEVAPFSNSVEKILSNAPEKKNALFKVPPVVG